MNKISIERVRSGKMNLVYYDGILVKKKLAYQAVSTEQLTSVFEDIKVDAEINKVSLYIFAVNDDFFTSL
nr:hypothetical protein [uncultured Bacteroides sp.]